MRKALIPLLAVCAIFLIAGSASAQISGTSHDLSTNYTDTNADRICVFCHTPHRSEGPPPLWNRTDPVGPYTMYTSTTSPTIDMTIGATPGAESLVCLSCHDGTVAFDELVNAPSVVGNANYTAGGADQGWTAGVGNFDDMTGIGGSALMSTDLQNDHPIAITYDNTADTDFKALATAKGNGLTFYGGGADQVECASCHQVHEPGTVAADTFPFLRVANNNSTMCLGCHSK